MINALTNTVIFFKKKIFSFVAKLENLNSYFSVYAWNIIDSTSQEARLLTYKRLYNKEAIAAFKFEIHQMSFKPPFPFIATQIINPFLNSIISANHEKERNFSHYTPHRSYSVEYLLLTLHNTKYKYWFSLLRVTQILFYYVSLLFFVN